MKIGRRGIGFITAGLLAIVHLQAFAGGNRLIHNPGDPLNPIQVRWDERMMPIKWVLSRDGYPGSGLTNSQLEAELQAAFDTWEVINTSAVTFSYEGQVDRRAAEVDGYHLVTFTDPATEFSPGAVGLAVTWSFTEETTIDSTNNDLDGNGTADIPNGVYAAGTVFDGNVLFNSSYDLTISGVHGNLDIRAIALHEIGHMIGLSHSSIPETVMWPFQNPDVGRARSLALDDIAYVSSFYPQEPEFSALFGSISGKVTNGFDNNRILGAHVYAVDIESGEKLVGAYTGVDGSYTLPIPGGNYFVGIEPLDGDPVALDPQRINEVIANTFDTSFTEELFDANESNIESDPLAALPVGVSAGVITPNIDIRTNTVNVPGVSRVLLPGINYFAYPVAVPTGLTAFDLLQALGDPSEINAIDRLNPGTQLFERASYVDGIPAGIDFPIRRGEGYIVHATKQKAVTFTGVPDCPRISLQEGLNLIGVPCPPSTYSAFDLLANIGSPYEIQSVKRYNPLNSASFQAATYSNSTPTGDDFFIVNGEAYFAEMAVNKNEIRVPGNANLFPPAITGISPGKGVPGEFILVTGEGFDADVQKNLITFNGVGAPIVFATPTTIAVSVPANATSGPVKVISNGRESNSVSFVIESKNVAEDPSAVTTLLPGQIARGSLTSASEQDRYAFLAAKGAVVTVRAEALSGADLLLALEGPSGVLLMSDDDSGGASNPTIRNFVLPEAGNYTVVVTSVAGSGAYDLFLEIRSTTSEPAISVLRGDAQSALAGTDLPKPLEVFVTSGIGKPLAGVAVTFTATDVDIAAPSQGYSLQDAGTAVITTNSNGIATVQATTPGASGVYDITVTVPGMEPVTMQVSATATAVARAIISKQVEECGGAGCEVNQKLPNPYVIQYLDNNDQPVADVLTGWKVVSGGGALGDFTPAANGHQVTGSDGRVEVFHTLGQKVFADLNGRPTKVPLMQAVAATVAGHDVPVLFSAISKAGPPAKMEGLNTNFSRLTYGTRGLNAIRLRVTDQFDNPVKGAVIDASGSDLEVTPGQLDSVPLLNYETNEDGIWVGAVSAANTIPTLDEFGNTGTPGLAAQYTVTVSHATAGSLSHVVDVDMGPEMVTRWGQSASALITQELEPVSKIVMRYQRIDTFEDIGDGTDDDNGDWTDEDFTDLRQVPIEGVAIQFTASRVDGFSEIEAGLTPTKINGQDEITLTTNAEGLAEATITLSEVGGAISILGEIFTPIVAQLKTDTGALIGSPVEYPLENYHRETTGVLAVPVEVEVALDADQASGIDWTSFVVSLNGVTTIFDGSAETFPPLNKFPNFFRLFIDGAELLEWPSADVLASGEFSELKLTYQPVGSELIEGENSLAINADIEHFGGTLTQLNEQETFTFNNDPENTQWKVEQTLNSAWAVDFGLNKTTSLAQMQNRAVPATGAGEVAIGDYEVPYTSDGTVFRGGRAVGQ